MSKSPAQHHHDHDRMMAVVKRLKHTYPDAGIRLRFATPLELLVATILAAQCTDERVNQVTKELFQKYKSPKDFVAGTQEELEQDIHSTGFFRNKAMSIRKCCQSLIDHHDGKVPNTMEELLTLGGVGRKTANVVLGNAFGVPGIAVDTHVKRLTGLLGFTLTEDPEKIETDLMAVVGKEDWTTLGHLFANHGRAVCVARRPKCGDCVLSDLCPSSQ